MPVKDSELLRLAGWPRALNNTAREDQLADGVAGKDGQNEGELRVALNVDVDDAGKMRTRPGRTRVAELPGLHSLWSDPRFPLMLAVYDGNLVAFNGTLQRTTVAALTAGNKPLSVDVFAGWAYWSNGVDTGRVNEQGEPGHWAPEQPLGQPTLSVENAGGLAAGNVAVAITFIDEFGRESGSTLAEEIDLSAGQGVRLENIPQPTRDDTARVRVSCSAPGGESLYAVYDLPVGITTFLIGAHTPGKRLETQFLEPLPAGELVCFHNGRQFVARGNVTYWSEALRPGLGNLAANYLPTPQPPTVFGPMSEGETAALFLATRAVGDAEGSTYFLTGPDPKAWRRARVYPHGAVPGSYAAIDAAALELDLPGRVPCWLSENGNLVAGTPTGKVVELHRPRFVANTHAERGSVALREYRGLRTLVAAQRGGTPNPVGVSDRASAEVWRDGVRIG